MRLFVIAALVNQALWFTSVDIVKVALTNQALWFTRAAICNSPTPKNKEGSCATPTTSWEDIIGQTRECELLVAGGKLPQVVALGKVYGEVTTLHNVPFSPAVAKVTVEKVRVPNVRVPLPSNEVTTMADAFKTFVAWPRHLIRIMLEPYVIISFHYINLYLYLYITYNLIQMFFIL